jgi:hypothetical protein
MGSARFVPHEAEPTLVLFSDAVRSACGTALGQPGLHRHRFRPEAS